MAAPKTPPVLTQADQLRKLVKSAPTGAKPAPSGTPQTPLRK